MTFQFEVDFDSEEIAVIIDQAVVAVVFTDELGKLATQRIKAEYEDFQDEILKVCKALMLLAENC